DFEHAKEDARRAINQWTSTETRGRLPELLAEDALDASTRFVLVNAVHFKGLWADQFEPYRTRPGIFTGPNGPVTAEMMTQVQTFRLARVNDVQVVELPYRGGISMIVVLPDAPARLRATEDQFADRYEAWVAALRRAPVDLELPRFSARSAFRLDQPLAALGMGRAFTAAADFSRATEAAHLQIDAVMQQA